MKIKKILNGGSKIIKFFHLCLFLRSKINLIRGSKQTKKLRAVRGHDFLIFSYLFIYFFFGGGLTFFCEGPNFSSSFLAGRGSNERPRTDHGGSGPMGGLKKTAPNDTNRERDKHPDRHGFSMTESAQCGRFSDFFFF